jgi:transposase-like protein
MPIHMAPYPPEFRTEAIRLARTSGKPHAQIARELGITGETLPDAGSSGPISTRGSATTV